MERLFNYQWGSMDGEASRIFQSTDIRCGDSDLKDFTLRASNLKGALDVVKNGGFTVVPQEATKFTASGCPPFWPHSTKGLVKASQRGGTGGEDDSTTFHMRDPWKVVFMHEGKKVEWHLVKTAIPLSIANVRNGRNEENPSSGKIDSSKGFGSPQQYLSQNPLQAGMKERDRVRKAAKDSTVYLLGSPHKKSQKPEGEKQTPDQDTVNEQKRGEKITGEEENGATKEQKRKDRHKSRKRVKAKEKNTKMQPKKSKSKYVHLREFLETRRQKRQKAGTLDPMAEVMMII